MRHPLIVLMILTAQVLCASTAHGSAWYVDMGLGATLAEEQKLNGDGADAEFDLGLPSASVALGYRFNGGWRLESEFAYRNNDLETVFWPDDGTVIRQDHYDGVRTSALSLNLIRRFRIGAFVPYLGGGIGAARVEWRMGMAPVGWGPNRIPRQPILDDEADTLALSFIAGFELPLSDRWGFSADYRLQHLPDFSLTGEDGADYDLSYTTHTATLHLAYLLSGRWDTAPSLPRPVDTTWYLAAQLGSGFAVDSEFADNIENLDAFKNGPVFSVAAGRMLTPHWRLEVAFEHRENDVEVVDFNPETGQFPATGKVKASSLMLSTAYRFRPGRSVRPFVGAGVGPAWMDYRVETRGSLYLDDDAVSPAFEIFAGLDIALTERLDFVADFRSWYTTPVKLENPDGVPYETWHWVNSFDLGLRYSL